MLYFFPQISPSRNSRSKHSCLVAAAKTATTGPRFCKPTGSCKQHSILARAFLQICATFEMNLTAAVRRNARHALHRSDVVQHRVDRGCKRFEFGEAGEDRAIADRRYEQRKSDAVSPGGVKFRCGRAGARFDLRRTRALEQLLCIEAAAFAPISAADSQCRLLSFSLGRVAPIAIAHTIIR